MKAADLRKSILQYAVEGKLVQQNIHDEPADMLYDKIIKEKENLIKQGKIKKEKPLPPITDDEIPYDIPNNWKWVRLGEVCDIIMGQSPDGNSVNTNNNGIEFHQGKSYFTNYYLDKSNYYTFKPTKIIEKDTLLLSVRAPVGALNFTKNQICIGRGLCGIIPLYGIINQLLFYFLKSIEKSFIKQATGTTFIAISKEIIYKQLFPLPPLKEQERIVKKIDELMALCDKLEQEEEKLSALDKHLADTLPKSILQYAVEGKLVQQNIHDEPASILYDKIMKEKENLIKQGKIKKEKPLPPITDDDIPYDIPNNWKWVRLGEVCEIYTGNSINAEIKNKKYTNLKQGYNYIATKDVNFNSIIDYNNGIKIPFDEINFKIAKKNTTLICIEGGSAGRKIGFLNQDVCFGNKLCSINGYLLHNKSLFYFAQSPIFLSIFNEYKAGIIGGVSVNLIKNIILPLPPLKEQERIVKKVDELLTYCNKLKDIFI